MPKVSIVLPTYNGGTFLANSIQSIIEQTFTDWELIIVNDCSTDNTQSVAERFANIDTRIKVYSNDINKKLPMSLNIGFEKTSGQYLTWTSDDNIFLPNAIEEMVEFLEKNECEMVRADMELINEKGESIGISAPYSNEKMIAANRVGACFLYTRKAYNEIGEYRADMFCVEDYDYWLRMLERYGTIGNIQKVIYQYRLHERSLTFTQKDLVRSQVKKLRKEHLEYLIENTQDAPSDWFDLYTILLDCGVNPNAMPKNIFDKVPTLKNDSKLNCEKKVYIYGAGDYGRRAMDMLRANVDLFIDRNPQKTGTTIEGIPIVKYEESIELMKGGNVIIALSQEKIFDVINDFQRNGIINFITFSYLEYQITKEN